MKIVYGVLYAIGGVCIAFGLLGIIAKAGLIISLLFIFVGCLCFKAVKQDKKNKAEKILKEQQEIERKKQEQERLQKAKEERQKNIEFLKNCENLLCFDCETTGVNFSKDEILKLSIIDRNNNVLFNELIKPIHRKKWDEAEAVNHISPQDVKEAKPITDYLPQLQEIFDKAELFVGYNLEFDMNFLSNSGILFRKQKQFDVMLEFAEIYGEWNERKGDYKWQKLSKCAAYYNYKWEGRAHDSLADTKATLFCFEEMLKGAK